MEIWNSVRAVALVLVIVIVTAIINPILSAFAVIIIAIACVTLLCKKELRMPIVALAVCSIPMIAWGLGAFFSALDNRFMLEIFGMIILGSWLGNLFYIMSAVISVIYLIRQISFAVLKEKEQINVTGIILSSISLILASVLMYIFIPIFMRGP